MSDLRPLGLGEIIDRSANFWRAHWKPLFRLYVAFQLAEFALVKANQLLSRRFFPALAGDAAALELMRTNPSEALPQFFLGIAALMITLLLTLLVSQVSGVAATHFSWPRITGRGEPSVGESVKHAMARLPATIGAFLLSIAWSLLVMVLLLLPGTLMVVGGSALLSQGLSLTGRALAILGVLVTLLALVVLMLWFIIRFILTSQVLSLENATALQTFKRTAALSSGRVGPGLGGWVKARLTVLVTIISAIVLLIGALAGLPTIVLGFVYGASFQPGHTVNDVVPAVLLVPMELLQVVVGSLFAPVYVVFQVMFYVDMRVRREGLDLELKLAEHPAA